MPAKGKPANKTVAVAPAAVAPAVVQTPQVAATPAATPAQAPAVITQAIVDPTPATEVKATEPTTETPAAAAPKKKERRQLSQKLGIQITAASVRGSLANMGMNKEIADAQKEISECASFANLSEQTLKYVGRAKPAKGEDGKTDEFLTKLHGWLVNRNTAELTQVPVNEETKKALGALVGRCSLRTGDDALYALVSSINFIIQELATYGVKALAAEAKKKLKMHHLMSDGVETLPFWAFLRNLKCVAAARALYKQYPNGAPKTQATEEKAPEIKEPTTTPAATTPAEGEKKTKRAKKDPNESYESRIHSIMSEVVRKHFEKGEVSGEVKSFGSHVVYELVDRYGKFIHIQTEFAGMKTIKASTITSINDFILSYGGIEYPEMRKFVDTRVEAYFAHTEQQKNEKRAKEALDPTKAAEKAAKKAKKSAAATAPTAETPATPAVAAA